MTVARGGERRSAAVVIVAVGRRCFVVVEGRKEIKGVLATADSGRAAGGEEVVEIHGLLVPAEIDSSLVIY